MDLQASNQEFSDVEPSSPAPIDGATAGSSSSCSKPDVLGTPSANVARESTQSLITSQRWADKVIAEKEQEHEFRDS